MALLYLWHVTDQRKLVLQYLGIDATKPEGDVVTWIAEDTFTGKHRQRRARA